MALFSLEDKYYYLIIKNSPTYNEFYIVTNDVGNIEELRPVDINKKPKKQKKQYREMLRDAEPIFKMDNYHSDYLIDIPNAIILSHTYSYFVVKDIDGIRYGEYRLPTLLSPLPINYSLWAYLFKHVTDEMKKNRDGSFDDIF